MNIKNSVSVMRSRARCSEYAVVNHCVSKVHLAIMCILFIHT